jgi:hypothetical protein
LANGVIFAHHRSFPYTNITLQRTDNTQVRQSIHDEHEPTDARKLAGRYPRMYRKRQCNITTLCQRVAQTDRRWVENIEEMAIRLEGNPAFEQWCLVNSHTDVGMRNARAATKSNPPLRLLEGSVKGHKCFKCADFDDPEETKEHMEFQRRSSVTPGIDSPKTLLGSGSC